jgi:hypothetical protein
MTKPEMELLIISHIHEIKKLLGENLLKDPEEARAGLEKARKLRQELLSYGYPIKWEAVFDPKTLSLEITVTAYKVRDDLTPELQAIYDKWLAEQNGFKMPDE